MKSSYVKEVLESVGFTSYEADIYLCLLQNGRLSAYQLSEKTGLYRQACYDALNRMLERGVVSKLKDGRRNIFCAANPDVILQSLNSVRDSFSQALPQLKTLQIESEDPVNVEVFKGKNVLKLGFIDVIETLKIHGGTNCVASVDEAHYRKVFGDAPLEYYGREMKLNRFTERTITKEGGKSILSGDVATYRSVPLRFFNQNPMQIYGNTVQILLTGEPNHLIIIRNQAIADSFRKQFELMWSVAKPLKRKGTPRKHGRKTSF